MSRLVKRDSFEPVFLPVSALTHEGHRIRLSLAGANAGTFAPPAPDALPTWTLSLGGDAGWLGLPERPWMGGGARLLAPRHLPPPERKTTPRAAAWRSVSDPANADQGISTGLVKT